LLENMLLLRKLQPWHANVGKRLVKSPKIYIRDSGLLHELLGIGNIEALAGHPVVGASWEGFVIENLLSCVPPRTEAYFYRTNAGAEIDLILKFRTGEIWAVEIKRGLSPSLTKGFHSALADVNPTKSFVVYGGEDRFKLKPGIEAIGLRLLQEELLALAKP
jgi:predicted AAA+ superfamily ATPase